MNKRKSRPTSLYEVESREADEKLAEARKKETARRVTTSFSYLKAARVQRRGPRYSGGRRIEPR